MNIINKDIKNENNKNIENENKIKEENYKLNNIGKYDGYDMYKYTEWEDKGKKW